MEIKQEKDVWPMLFDPHKSELDIAPCIVQVCGKL